MFSGLEAVIQLIDHIGIKVESPQQFIHHKLHRQHGIDPIHLDNVVIALIGDHSLPQHSHTAVNKALSCRQSFDIGGHRFGKLRGDLFDAGHNPQTNFVAQIFSRGVRGILPKRNIVMQSVI